jgi:tetratricopeptide (TPR) repeat protein
MDKSFSFHSDYRLQSIQRLVVINTLLDGLPVKKWQRSIPEKSLISENALQDILNLERNELRDVIGVVSNCYAVSDRIDPLRPDMLGEWIIVDELRKNEELLLSLVEKLSDNAVNPIFKVLNRITAQTEYRAEGITWIKMILSSDPSRFADIALSVAREAGDPISQILTEMLRDNSNSKLARDLESHLPEDTLAEYTVTLRELPVVVMEQCLADLRERASTDDLMEEARLSHKLGLYLHALGFLELDREGTQEQAIGLMEKSISLYRQFQSAAPSMFSAELAMALNNIGLVYAKLGRRAGALRAASEAVEIYRGLESDQPNAFSFFLATSLNTYANRLCEAYRYVAAQKTAVEAVSIWRRLAKQTPEGFNQYLALALNNFGQILGKRGNWEGSVPIAREAVQLYQGIRHPGQLDAVEPADQYLATSLTNLGNCLQWSGEVKEALEVLEEAVDIYRRLVESGVASCVPDLAIALHNLSQCRKLLGDKHIALEIAEKAVRTLLPCYHNLPDVYKHWMSKLIMNYESLSAALGNTMAPDLTMALDISNNF